MVGPREEEGRGRGRGRGRQTLRWWWWCLFLLLLLLLWWHWATARTMCCCCFVGGGLDLCAVADNQLDGRRDLWQNCRLVGSLGEAESRCVGEEMEGGGGGCFAKRPTR